MKYLGTHDFSGATVTGVGGFADYKTIGSGGDYADVQAFIDGGDTGWGVLVANVTEDSAVTMARDLKLNLNGNTWTLGTNAVTTGGFDVYMRGPGELDSSVTATDAFVTTSGDIIDFDGFTWDQNGASAGKGLATQANTTFRIRNMRIEGSNANQTGLNIGVQDVQHIVENVTFVGGGSSCSKIIYVGGETHASNLRFEGTYSQSVAILDGNNPDAQIHGVVFDTAGLAELQYAGILTNLQSDQTGRLEITFGANDAILSNVRGTDIDIGDTSENTTGHQLSNLQLGSGGIIMGTSSNTWNVSNVETSAAVTINGDFHRFSNCIFGGTLTMDSGTTYTNVNNCRVVGAFTDNGDYNNISNNHFVSTFTVAAGADGGIYDSNLWAGNVSTTGDNGKYGGHVYQAITFTLNSTASNNLIDIKIDQAVTDNSGVGTNVIRELIY